MTSVAEQFANRRILISGGSGFIGANLVRLLLSVGAQVYITKRRTTSLWRLHEVIDSITLFDADICEVGALTQIIQKCQPEFIFHLATPRGSDSSAWLRMVQCNTTAALSITESLQSLPGTRVIVAGSAMEYGPKERPHKEQDKISPSSWNGVGKAASSLIYQQAAHSMDMNIAMLRLFHVYGPWESSHRLLPSAFGAAASGSPLPLTEGDIRRDWVYINDVINALLRAAIYAEPGESYNIGSGVEQSNLDVIHMVEELTGCTIHTAPGSFLPSISDSPHRCADNTKAETTLGWRAEYDFRSGIAAMLNWLHENPDYPGIESGGRPLHV